MAQTAKIIRHPAAHRRAPQQTRHSRRMQRALRLQLYKAHAGAAIVASLLAVSLYDQAVGVHLITRAPWWECWALATGIEVGFVSLKLDILMAATEATRRHVVRYARPALYATVGASAVMNAYAMSASVDGLAKAPAIALGVLVSYLVLQISQSTARMYLACRD